MLTLLIDDIIQRILCWTNGHILLQNLGRKRILQFEMYEMLAVIFFAGLSGISLQNAVSGLSKYDCNKVTLENVCFIVQNSLT